jgi:CheY-like chemotaxis protein
MAPIKGKRANPDKGNAPGARLNSIGVPAGALGALLDHLDGRGDGAASVKRIHSRWPFRHGAIRLTLEHPGGSRSEIMVACRNLSRGGAGLLHCAYVHMGTPCIVHLPLLSGGVSAQAGTIVRCTHLRDLIHELGVCFRENIPLSDFVERDPLLGGSSFEKVDPASLSGSVLAITRSEDDDRNLMQFLAETKLELRFAHSLTQAIECAAAPPDVIMLDLAVPEASEILNTLRKGCSDAPVIAFAEEAGAAVRQQLVELDVAGFLLKPLTSDSLRNALADCRFAASSGSLTPGTGMPAPVVHKCVEVLLATTGELQQAVLGEDAMRCFALAQQIRGVAFQLGLREVVRAADATGARVAASMSVPDAAEQIHQLIGMCRRVRQSAHAA